MNVIKRDGRKEQVMFDKITARINKLCYGLCSQHVYAPIVAQKVIQGVYDGVTTMALDDLAAETAAYLTTQHPDYSRLAARIAVSNLHKMTDKSFSATMTYLHQYINPRNGQAAPLISDDVFEVIKENKERLDATLVYRPPAGLHMHTRCPFCTPPTADRPTRPDPSLPHSLPSHLLSPPASYDRDFEYDFFGYKTLEKSYLLRLNGVVAERPQQMLMRVSLGIHKRDIVSATANHTGRSPWNMPAAPLDRASPAAGRCDRDLPPHVAEVVHTRDAYDVQCRHAVPSNVVMLPAGNEGGLDRWHFRDAQPVRPDLQVGGRHRPLSHQYPRFGLIH